LQGVSKHITEEKTEGRDRSDGRTRKKDRILEIERGHTSSHSVENWLWKRIWTCRKTGYEMNK
jgi:hypothetical protein